MKIAMNLLLWTASYDDAVHAPILEKLKGLGYDGAELTVGGESPEEYRPAAERLRSLDLECTGVCAPPAEANPASPDAAVRARAVDWLKQRVDITHALGANILCGPNHSAFAQFTRAEPKEQEYQWSADTLAAVADHAQAAGVTFAIEAINRFECYLCNTAAQLRGLIDRVDHPAIRTMIDTHHVNIEEKSFAEAVKTLGDTLVHVHICENDRGAPGSGQIDFDDVFAVLSQHGYDGWFAIESFSRSDVDFANAINVWRSYSTVDEVCADGIKLIREMIAKHYA